MDSSSIKCDNRSLSNSLFGIISVLEPDEHELSRQGTQKEVNCRIELAKKCFGKQIFSKTLLKNVLSSPDSSITNINEEISQLKQTVTSMIKQITMNNKESILKKEKFKTLESFCDKNKKKLKKLKNSIKSHQEILLNLEKMFKIEDGNLPVKKTGKNRPNYYHIDSIKLPNFSNQKFYSVNLAFGPNSRHKTPNFQSKNCSPRQLTQILVP